MGGEATGVVAGSVAGGGTGVVGGSVGGGVTGVQQEAGRS